jgi:3-oxoadipate enol-lactonase
MILVGSAIAFPEPGRATFRALADKAARDGMAAIAGVAMRRMFPDAFIAASPEIIAGREAVFGRIDAGVFATACRALATLDLSADLARITTPILIVVGAEDEATPPALGQALANRLTDAQLTLLPGLAARTSRTRMPSSPRSRRSLTSDRGLTLSTQGRIT